MAKKIILSIICVWLAFGMYINFKGIPEGYKGLESENSGGWIPYIYGFLYGIILTVLSSFGLILPLAVIYLVLGKPKRQELKNLLVGWCLFFVFLWVITFITFQFGFSEAIRIADQTGGLTDIEYFFKFALCISLYLLVWILGAAYPLVVHYRENISAVQEQNRAPAEPAEGASSRVTAAGKRWKPILILSVLAGLLVVAILVVVTMSVQEKKQKLLPDSLFMYKGVGIGMNEQGVLNALGAPKSKDESAEWEGVISWQYDNFDISLDKTTGKVISICPTETSSGIKKGDSAEKIIKLYGSGTIIPSRYGDKNYQIQYKIDEQRQIFFAMADGKVAFIMIGAFLAD